MTRKNIHTNLSKQCPYNGKLDLSSLLNYWRVNLDSGKTLTGYPSKQILKMLDEAEELNNPIEDLKVLEENKETLGFLMSAVFPSVFVDTDYMAAIAPFDMIGFYATPGYRGIFPENRERIDISVNLPGNDIYKGKVLNAGVQILNKFYGCDIKLDKPLLVTVPEDENPDLNKVFKVDLNTQFSEVKLKGNLPELSKLEIRHLLDNLYDTELWLQNLPPENFEFQGFSVVRLVDVTIEEMLSSIKYDLLKKDAVTCGTSFESIQNKLRSIFKLPLMKMGLSYFDPQNNIVSNYGAQDWKSFLLSEIDRLEQDNKVSCDCFEGSIYSRAYESKRPIIVENLEEYQPKTDIERQLIKKGIKNIVIAPLLVDGEVAGMLELGTPFPSKLNSANAGQLENVLPMFTAAVRRVIGEMQTEVRAIIQEECTAIHPSVEWKFLEEGYNILQNKMNGQKSDFGNIVFKDVYPLYGMSDIRNSSGERNMAIQKDLYQNLVEAKELIKTIIEHKKMPILDELKFQIENQLNNVSTGLESGDESSIVDFIKYEVQPAVNHFKDHDEDIKPIITKYEDKLDANLGIIYNERRKFEESLTHINETISSYLDRVEEQAQDIFPHYFEKYKTDGVEYNIYVGQSLVKDKKFDILYLRNMRLWQLITMSEIAISVRKLKEELPKKLDIAQLILVHGDPLSIKFRQEEKHFDVDGAYNIRYEIVKKRIDKAHIKNTDERLTQPGKISIVYTQQKEAEEYKRYIEYLQKIGYLTEEIEQFELEELQGAQGLKALRVEVNAEADKIKFADQVLKQVAETVEA